MSEKPQRTGREWLVWAAALALFILLLMQLPNAFLWMVRRQARNTERDVNAILATQLPRCDQSQAEAWFEKNHFRVVGHGPTNRESDIAASTTGILYTWVESDLRANRTSDIEISFFFDKNGNCIGQNVRVILRLP